MNIGNFFTEVGLKWFGHRERGSGKRLVNISRRNAISIKAVTGVPIKFVGLGEKLEPLEPFHPDRMASRILGMGDVLSLVEKAKQTFDAEEA